MGTINLADALRGIENDVLEEERSLFGAMASQPPHMSPKYDEILAILQQRPILVQPTLIWLRGKLQQLAQAELSVLYTAEELDALRKAAEEV